MEQNQPNPGTSLFQLNLDAGNSYTLRSAASWAKVLAITGIIIGVLFFAVGLLMQNAISNNYGNNRYYGGGSEEEATRCWQMQEWLPISFWDLFY